MIYQYGHYVSTYTVRGKSLDSYAGRERVKKEWNHGNGKQTQVL